MAEKDENPPTPGHKNNRDHKSPISVNSQSSSSSSHAFLNTTSTNPDYIFSVAAKIASQPLQCSDTIVWGVLTAISDNARKRHQGMDLLLTSDVHWIGRTVEDVCFQIAAPAVSASHCRIFRKSVTNCDVDNPSSVCCSAFLKDSVASTNGTYLNSRKLNKTSSEAKLCHGDVISIALAPQHEDAYAFVFREVSVSFSSMAASGLKRKADDPELENKRLKGIGIGATEDPISLDYFRSLQRSNTELRKKLEEQVVRIDSLQSECHAATETHENIILIELKVLKDSEYFHGQLKEMQQSLEAKEEELVVLKRSTLKQEHAMDDLNERIGSYKQSCVEANEVINSQKVSISELKVLLDEEREQRRVELENAMMDLKTSIQRVQADAQEKVQRLSDASLRREKEQQEVIDKLQNSEEETSLLVESLRSKLEDTRHKLDALENKARQLEAQVVEEQTLSASRRKGVMELVLETIQMRKEIQHEKAAREEACAKVSALELEIITAMSDLDFERRRLKGAKERIILRDTQLRAFYSTTEEIQFLCAKQQEQLKAMQRTLGNEENEEDALVQLVHIKGSLERENEVQIGCGSSGKSVSCTSSKRLGRDQDKTSDDETIKCSGKSVSCTSSKRHGRDQDKTSNDETCKTKNHDCNIDGDDHLAKVDLGSEIDACAHMLQADPLEPDKYPEIAGTYTKPNTEGDLVGTERVLDTESAGANGGSGVDMNKCGSFVQDIMQVDDETHGSVDQTQMVSRGSLHQSEYTNPLSVPDHAEDTQAGGRIRMGYLLASEVPGSWACSIAPSNRIYDLFASEVPGSRACGTAPSIQMENDSPMSKDNDKDAKLLHNAGETTAERQHTPPSKDVAVRWTHERQKPDSIAGIFDRELKDQFSCAVASDCNWEGLKEVDSGSDTEGCSDGNGANNEDEHKDEDDETTQGDSP